MPTRCSPITHMRSRLITDQAGGVTLEHLVITAFSIGLAIGFVSLGVGLVQAEQRAKAVLCSDSP